MDLVIELCGDQNYWEGKHKYIQFSQIFFLYYFLGRIPFGTNLKGTSQWFSTLAEIFLKIPGLWGRRLSVWTLHPHPRLIKCDATGVAPGIVLYLKISLDCCHCQVASVLSDSVQPHRQQPTRLPYPWDSPGKNTSGLPFPSPMQESEKWKGSRSVVSDPQRPHGLQPTRLLRPWDFPGKSTGVGYHCLHSRMSQ